MNDQTGSAPSMVADVPAEAEPQPTATVVAVTNALTAKDPLNAYRVQLGDKTYLVQVVTGARLFKLGNILVESFDLVADSGFVDGSWRNRAAKFIPEALKAPIPIDAPEEERKRLREERVAAEREKMGRAMANAVAELWDKTPDVFGEIVCILLSAPKEDIEYILEYLEPMKVFDIIDAFMERNQVMDVLERFFVLREKVWALIEKVRNRGKKTTQPSTPPLNSPEQATDPTPLTP